MSRTQKRVDHAKRTKMGFLLGVSLFVVAELTEPIQRAIGMGVPGWEHSLLLTAGFIGILLALLSPFVFGIVFPLIE